MTDERIAALREFTKGDASGCLMLAECLDEIVRLQGLHTPECLGRQERQADHIRRLREALRRIHDKEEAPANRGDVRCPDCRLLAETEPERGYQPRNPTPLDPMTMKPPAGGSAVVEPRP